MQRLISAFRFIDLSFRLAQDHESIQKPWMYLSLGFILLTLFWMAPASALIIGLGSTPLVWSLIGLIVLLYFVCLSVWGEITALSTAKIFESLARDDPEAPETEAKLTDFNAHWADILIYVISLPFLTLMLGIRALFSGPSGLNRAWMKAHPLLPAIIALEGRPIKGAIGRLREILAENYLRFQPQFLPIGGITRTVQWMSALAGIAGGTFIAARIANPLSAERWPAFWAVSAGLAAGGILFSFGLAFSTYFRACYYTSLVVWASRIESVHKGSGEGTASPPEILTRAMHKAPVNEEDGSDATET